MSTAAPDRLRRLLSMIPWIIEADPTVDEICARYEIDRAELISDIELLSLCGVAPFTPDVMIEADVQGDHVSIRMADWFRRPLRLTAPEALAIVVSAQAALAIEGADPTGPLARALSKLAGILGVAPGDDVEVTLGDAESDVLRTVQGAAADHRQVEIDYYSFGRDEWGRRTVEPWLVFSLGGAWYVRAYCHKAVGPRLFRIDRMRSATELEVEFDPPADRGPLTVFESRPGDAIVDLEVTRNAAWVADRYPNLGVKRTRGRRLRIRLPISEPAWLERLLVILGPDGRVVEVVDGPDGLASAGRAAAARILDRYADQPT